jgi:hypothetical protein
MMEHRVKELPMTALFNVPHDATRFLARPVAIALAPLTPVVWPRPRRVARATRRRVA